MKPNRSGTGERLGRALKVRLKTEQYEDRERAQAADDAHGGIQFDQWLRGITREEHQR